MNDLEIVRYELDTLAAYEAEDLDYPVMDVAYETESGGDHWDTVCLVAMAERVGVQINKLVEKNDILRNTIDLQSSNITKLLIEINHLKLKGGE